MRSTGTPPGAQRQPHRSAGQARAGLAVQGTCCTEQRSEGTNHASVVPAESREMLGIGDQPAYNGPAHSPAPRTWRSFRMRVKLQLVMCSDDGQEETVTDVITLNKNSQRIEHLGLPWRGPNGNDPKPERWFEHRCAR